MTLNALKFLIQRANLEIEGMWPHWGKEERAFWSCYRRTLQLELASREQAGEI